MLSLNAFIATNVYSKIYISTFNNNKELPHKHTLNSTSEYTIILLKIDTHTHHKQAAIRSVRAFYLGQRAGARFQ